VTPHLIHKLTLIITNSTNTNFARYFCINNSLSIIFLSVFLFLGWLLASCWKLCQYGLLRSPMATKSWTLEPTLVIWKQFLSGKSDGAAMLNHGASFVVLCPFSSLCQGIALINGVG
ncbi:hypothetical protein L9F63_008276, partial [Diploptera punctata]